MGSPRSERWAVPVRSRVGAEGAGAGAGRVAVAVAVEVEVGVAVAVGVGSRSRSRTRARTRSRSRARARGANLSAGAGALADPASRRSHVRDALRGRRSRMPPASRRAHRSLGPLSRGRVATRLVSSRAGGPVRSRRRRRAAAPTSSRAANVLRPHLRRARARRGTLQHGRALGRPAERRVATGSRTRSPRLRAPRRRGRRRARNCAARARGRRPAADARQGRGTSRAAMTSSSGESRGVGVARLRVRRAASPRRSPRRPCRRNGALPLHSSMSRTATAKTSAAGVSSPAGDLLGRHVPGRAEDALAARRRRHGRRDAEVDDLDLALLVDHHVARRDVAVDDVHAAVRVVERAADLDADVRALFGRRGPCASPPAAAQELRDAHALDELHREEVRPELDAELVHGDDVRVRERDGRLRLLDEAPHEVVVARELVADLLHDELLLEPARAAQRGEHHARHAPARQLALEHVLAEDLRVHSGPVRRIHRSKHKALAAVGVAAAAIACSQSAPVTTRTVTLHTPKACAVSGAAFGQYFELGDFDPASPTTGHPIGKVGTTLSEESTPRRAPSWSRRPRAAGAGPGSLRFPRRAT